MKINIATILILIFFAQIVLAQNTISEKFDFEKVIENLLPQQEVDIDYNDFYDRLFSLYTNPLSINTAERTDLQSLFFLTDIQISELIDYRSEYGKLMSIFELLSLNSFDNATVQKLSPFVSFKSYEEESLLKSLKNPDIHDVFVRYQSVLEQKKGYTDPDTTRSGNLSSRYAGGPQRVYTRYLISKPGRYSLGFTMEKDPGEKIIWDRTTSRYGMDYYSIHAMVENVGFLKKIVLGDFSMDYGQGLVYGSGLSFGKGVETISTIRRNNLGLRPYRSVFENRDYSGIAVATRLSFVNISAFFSNVNRDAVIREGMDQDFDEYFSSVQTIGLHRTTSEIAAKNRLRDQSIGGNLSIATKGKKIEVGINWLHSEYSVPLQATSRNYSQFAFNGVTNDVGSIYFNYYLKGAHLFGEFAVSKSGGKAISTGVIASLSSQVQASLHIRRHEKNFHSFYGNSFGENSRIVNESGIYWGLKIVPVQRLIMNTYFDLFRFPWMKYRVDGPSSGNDFMIAANFQANRKLNFRLQFRNKLTEINQIEQGRSEPLVAPRSTRRLLFTLNYDLNELFSIQSRIQGSNVKISSENSSGFMLAQDINFKKQKYSVSARFALFDTDSYDSRQFIYERDLLYLYSIPSFSNTGIRYYLLTKINLSRNIDVWFKLSQTKYVDQDTIGTGLEEINGNTKTSVNAQLRVKL